MVLGTVGADLSGGSTATPFEDVPESSWFAPYVAYGVEHHIINSTLSRFRPNDTVTREEAMKILALALEIDTGKYRDFL